MDDGLSPAIDWLTKNQEDILSPHVEADTDSSNVNTFTAPVYKPSCLPYIALMLFHSRLFLYRRLVIWENEAVVLNYEGISAVCDDVMKWAFEAIMVKDMVS